MTDLFVNLFGLLLIAAIIWWFWLSTATAKKVDNQQIDIVVENGVYSPARIEVIANQEFVLRFIRKDASPCAEKVLFNQLDRSIELSLSQPTEMKLTLSEPGEYHFSCDMQMYRGSLVVLAAK